MAEWHDLRDPLDPELDRLAARFGLHPLHIEDCRHRSQAAKVEENPGYLFIVLKPLRLLGDDAIVPSDLDIFLGRDFLITVQEGDDSPVRHILDGIRRTAEPLRADQLAYRITDGVVDSYLPLIDHFSETLEQIEDEVLDDPSPQALARIFRTKRSLIELRRILANTRDVANHLLRIDNDLISRDTWVFLRDVYDHAARSLDLVEMQRDLLAGTLDLYLSSVANRTNAVMKALTILGTVALPVLVVSSFYGMNLPNLPWADSPGGLTFVVLLMAGLTLALAAVLRYFRWL